MKTITKQNLDKLIKQAEGDWDFLIYLLKEYWNKKERKIK